MTFLLCVFLFILTLFPVKPPLRTQHLLFLTCRSRARSILSVPRGSSCGSWWVCLTWSRPAGRGLASPCGRLSPRRHDPSPDRRPAWPPCPLQWLPGTTRQSFLNSFTESVSRCEASCLSSPHPDRAADEASSVVNFQDSLEQLVAFLFIFFEPVLHQVHWLRHAPSEIHESVGRVAPIQCLIASAHPRNTHKQPLRHLNSFMLILSCISTFKFKKSATENKPTSN